MLALATFNPEPSKRAFAHNPSAWVDFCLLCSQQQHIHMSEGFPDFSTPVFVTDIINRLNKHPELIIAQSQISGVSELTKVLQKVYSDLYKVTIETEEILLSFNSNLALYFSFYGWLQEKDEVLVMEPAFHCYSPMIETFGGVPVSVPLHVAAGATSASQFVLNFTELESKITRKTKMLVLSNPHFPTGKVFTRFELEMIAEIVKKNNLIVVADEIYEFHVWKKEDMIRFASLPGMFEHTISIGSATETFLLTDRQLGWLIAPKALLEPLKWVYRVGGFICSAATQQIVAEAFQFDWMKYKTDPVNSFLATKLANQLQEKCKLLALVLQAGGSYPILPNAGCFMFVDFSFQLNRRAFKFLPKEKLLSIQSIATLSNTEVIEKNNNLIRFCFLKNDKVFHDAIKTLSELNQ